MSRCVSVDGVLKEDTEVREEGRRKKEERKGKVDVYFATSW
jgi:hypothetical protein